MNVVTVAQRIEQDRRLRHRLEEAIIDWQIVIDDTKAEIDSACSRLQHAVAQRDHCRHQLADVLQRLAA
jgi:hypothetical protein